MVAVGFRQVAVPCQGMDLEAVVRPVVHPVARPMAMVLVAAVAAMAASILQRFGPVGRPPGLTPSNASDAREFSRPIFVDFVCRASSHAAMIAVAIRFASVLSASAANRQPIRPR